MTTYAEYAAGETNIMFAKDQPLVLGFLVTYRSDETGAEYEMIHAVGALVAVKLLRAPLAAALLLGGSLLFAGTLYAMAFGAPHWLGAVTPLGGAGMIAGWLLLAFGRH